MPAHRQTSQPQQMILTTVTSRGRQLALAVALVGPPAGLGLLHPALGAVVGAVELLALLTVLLTAVYGSDRTSERAFRIIRLALNRAEPASAATTT